MAPLAPVTSTCTTDQATAVAPRATITLAARGALRPRHRRGGHRRPGQRARAARAPPGAARGRGRRRRRGGHRADRPQLRRHPRRHLLQARIAEGAAVRRRGRAPVRRTARSAASRCERCGKVIVALHEGELDRLDELERRGQANAVPGPAPPARRGDHRARAPLRRHRRPALAQHRDRRLRRGGAGDGRRRARRRRRAGPRARGDGRGARERRGPPGGRRGGRAPRGLLRRRAGQPPGGGGRRAAGPAHRALPRAVPEPAPARPRARQRPHLPGARSGPALPRRSPHAPHLGRRAARAVGDARRRPALAGDVEGGAALLAHRGARAAHGGQQARLRRRLRALRARTARRPTSRAGPPAYARRRWGATARWSTTSSSPRPT